MRPLLTGLLLALLASASAGAQPMREIRGAPAGQFDFYVLALSWSPGFCEVEGGDRNREQCETGGGLGFVVHGLWPQLEQGYPTHCRPEGRVPSRLVVEAAREIYPDEGLARHQWRKHGNCSGQSPADYFASVRRAADLVRIPNRLARPETPTKALPIEIERAFADANPGLRPDMMAVSCRRRLFLEIRVCIEKNLRGFRRCEQVDRDGCDGSEVTINAVR